MRTYVLLLLCSMSLVGLGCGDQSSTTSCSVDEDDDTAEHSSPLTGPDVWTEANLPVFNSEHYWLTQTGAVGTLDTDMHSLAIPLSVPHGNALKGFSVTYSAAGGHKHLPEGLPMVSLIRTNVITAESEWLFSATDDVKTVDEYQRPHEVVIDDVYVPVDRSAWRYQLTFDSEYGEGAVPGAVIIGARWRAGVATPKPAP